jgi:hypothetical protein
MLNRRKGVNFQPAFDTVMRDRAFCVECRGVTARGSSLASRFG